EGRAGYEPAGAGDGGGATGFDHALLAFARRHGVPEAAVRSLAVMRSETRRRTLPAPRITPFQPGDLIRGGNRAFEALCTPGHTGGLIILWNEAERILLADDMVLTPISPNISSGPAAPGNPLADYLASLERVAAIPARLTLTGHRGPIDDLAGRCAELVAHHRRRLEETAALIDGRRTAWEVAQGLFARQINSTATMLFALGETVAHLEYLARQDRLQRHAGEDGLLRYVAR
ncbi:MAG TPA: MBL fold metallo-hydrolase, partial [Bacillota bacterium]